ncbi:MAG: hypothetical protein J3K34DRAFT_404020 [Monoraphidium minutum]|nr:MAG: hypothetical protein J3K34DRAFT_404020 [Monoraphidium minutum]
MLFCFYGLIFVGNCLSTQLHTAMVRGEGGRGVTIHRWRAKGFMEGERPRLGGAGRGQPPGPRRAPRPEGRSWGATRPGRGQRRRGLRRGKQRGRPRDSGGYSYCTLILNLLSFDSR